jgi:hypothetical protein
MVASWQRAWSWVVLMVLKGGHRDRVEKGVRQFFRCNCREVLGGIMGHFDMGREELNSVHNPV